MSANIAASMLESCASRLTNCKAPSKPVNWRIPAMQIRRTLLFWSFVFLVLLPAAKCAEAQSFSLEQVMSSPFPSELIASKRGDKIAWIFYSQGRRNIWIAEAPAFAARQLTRHDVDDGQEITDII